MPNLTKTQIVTIAEVMLTAGGASQSHAKIVAEHLAAANLAGHDSHGFIRIPQYLDAIKKGSLDPKAEPEIVNEHGGIVQINGHSTFGQVVATISTELAINKARIHGLGLVTMGNLNHTGRIGTYPEIAARAGMASIMFTGFAGGDSFLNAAPFGGRSRRLGTNPISMGFPYKENSPILLDFASTMAAEGKLRVYRNKGQELPEPWVIDKEGKPSTDPNSYYQGGAILPVGGIQGGHKGYALSVMIALFGGLLGQIKVPSTETGAWTGSTIIAMDIASMGDIGDIHAEVENMVEYLKNTPLMEGSKEILYPGEIEKSNRDSRSKAVDIDDNTWSQVANLFDEYNVATTLKHVLSDKGDS